MRGILSAAGYVPYRRLARADIASFMGSGGGKGTRAVASHDEDTTTLGVEAARLALRAAPGRTPEALWFATLARPTWTRRTPPRWRRRCACPATSAAYDFGGALRSGMGCLFAALRGTGTTLVVAADLRDGLPTSADEAAGGDGGAAVLVGDGPDVLAELVAAASATDEFTDRWRAPGDRTRGCGRSASARTATWPWARRRRARPEGAGLETGDVGRLVVTGMHGRAVAAWPRSWASATASWPTT